MLYDWQLHMLTSYKSADATMTASTLIARIVIPTACCLVMSASYGQQRGEPPQ
jgi:hypothetical protein